MRSRMSRRGFLTAAAGAGAASLTGCAGLTPGAGTQGMRVSSYGDATKLTLRGKVVTKYNGTHGGHDLSFEGTPTNDYWDKLSTQFAGGNAPDIINIDGKHISQYAASGQLAPLDPYIPSVLRTSYFTKGLLAQGRLMGKQFGVPVATSTYAMGYDTTVLDDLGLTVPDPTWTWDDFAGFAVDIHKAAGGSVYGSEDAGGELNTLEIFLRGRGHALMSEGGQLGFTAELLGDWFGYWDTLRGNGGCVPADIGAQYVYGDWPNSPLVNRKAVLSHIMTPNFTGGFQALTKHKLALTLPPLARKGGRQAQYAAPSSQLSLNVKCKDLKVGAEFIDWFVSSTAATTLLQFISGPPASEHALDALSRTRLDAADKAIITYTEQAARGAFAAPPPQSQAFTPISDLLLRTNQDVAFGKQKIAEAASNVISQATALLKQG